MLLEEIAGTSLNPVNHQNDLFSFEEKEGYKPFEGRFFIITPKKGIPFFEVVELLYKVFDRLYDEEKTENLAYIINFDVHNVRRNRGKHTLKDLFELAQKRANYFTFLFLGERILKEPTTYFEENKKILGLDYDVQKFLSKRMDEHTFKALTDPSIQTKVIQKMSTWWFKYTDFLSAYPNMSSKEALIYYVLDMYSLDLIGGEGFIYMPLEEMRTRYLDSNIFLGKIL